MRSSTPEKLLGALSRSRSGWVTTLQLAERLSVDRNTVSEHLNRLVERQQVLKRPSPTLNGNAVEWRIAS